jgi:hypothetical protein
MVRTVSLILVSLVSSVAFASVTDTGFGSQATALAGMTAGVGPSEYSAFLNPARIGQGLTKKSPFKAGLGLSVFSASFKPIDNIVVENSVMSSVTTPRYGSYDPSVSTVVGQWLGAEYFAVPQYGLSVGVATYLPVGSLAVIDTGPLYQPEYVLYRTRWQRPKVAIGGSLNAGSGFRVGASLDIGFGTQAAADLYLQAGAGRASDQRLIVDIKPVFAPILGASFDTAYGAFAATVRGESKTEIELTTSANARVFGSLGAAIDFGYVTQTMLAYDPWSFELAYSTPPILGVIGKVQVDIQMWSQAKLPVATIDQSVSNNCNGNPGCTSQFEPSIVPEIAFRDIVIPRFGIEIPNESFTFRAGYAYRPGVFEYLPSGATNFVDPDRHIVSGGFEIPITAQVKFLAHVQYQLLVEDVVVKSAGDEFGNTTAPNNVKIGAPGYTIGGSVFGGGASLSFVL